MPEDKLWKKNKHPPTQTEVDILAHFFRPHQSGQINFVNLSPHCYFFIHSQHDGTDDLHPHGLV